MDSDNILSGVVSTLFGDVGRLAVFALFVPVLVRVVGQDGYGIYALVMAVFAPTRVIVNAGLFEATKTYLSRTDTREASTVASTSLAVHTVMAGVGVGGLLSLAASGLLDPTLQASIAVVTVALAGEQLFKFGRAVFHAHQAESLVEPLILVRSVILAAVGVGLARTSLGVTGVFVGFAAGFSFAGVVAGWQVVRRTEIDLSVRSISLAWSGRLLRFGGPSMLLLLMTIGLYKTDILLMGYFRTSQETGHYRAALQIAEFVWTVSIATKFVMIQSTANLWADGNIKAVSKLTARVVRYVIVLTLLILVGIAVLADEFVGLYFGRGFDAAVTPLRVLLPGVLGFAVARVVWPVLQAGGHLRPLLVATGGAFGANVALNLFFIPRFGVVGAAVATTVSYLLMGVGHVAVARSVEIYALSDLPVAATLGATAVTGAVLFVLDRILGAIASLLVLPPAGAVIFLIFALATGVVRRDEALKLYARIEGLLR
jgi:O-antigen/teichoic acid export membrane protein